MLYLQFFRAYILFYLKLFFIFSAFKAGEAATILRSRKMQPLRVAVRAAQRSACKKIKWKGKRLAVLTSRSWCDTKRGSIPIT